jgi:hypothetical protein
MWRNSRHHGDGIILDFGTMDTVYLVVRTLGITGAHKKARDGHALRGLFVLSKELVWTMDTIPDSKATY